VSISRSGAIQSASQIAEQLGRATMTRAGTGIACKPAACCPAVLGKPLSEEQAVDVAQMFAALAEPVRLRILGLIADASAGEVCACELVGPLHRSQPTVSHHLKVLHDAGLVEREKRGTWVWYRVVPERVEALRAALLPSQRGG